jgi:hypothetical protein
LCFPLENTLGALLVTDFTPQLSTVVGNQALRYYPLLPEAASFTVTGLRVMVGLILSTTVTIWLVTPAFIGYSPSYGRPFPMGKNARRIISYRFHATVISGSWSSISRCAVAFTFTVTGAAQVMVGLIVSTLRFGTSSCISSIVSYGQVTVVFPIGKH